MRNRFPQPDENIAPPVDHIIRIVGEIHSSKNSRQVFRVGSRTIVAKSKASKNDESILAVQLASQITAWEKITKGKQFPYYVKFRFLRGTKRRWDFSNLVQGVADAMVKAGYIPDDDVEHFIPVYTNHEVVGKAVAGVWFWI